MPMDLFIVSRFYFFSTVYKLSSPTSSRVFSFSKNAEMFVFSEVQSRENTDSEHLFNLSITDRFYKGFNYLCKA